MGIRMGGDVSGASINDDVALQPGSRFCLTALGAARCPKLAKTTGTVVGPTHTKSGYRVRLDGTTTIRVLHRTYVMSLDIAVNVGPRLAKANVRGARVSGL
jgi:hypothetical protein